MKTIQQKLADRIYELLPHKKELEFGCELKNIYAPSHHNYTFVSTENGLVTAVYNGSKEIEKDKMKDIFSDMKLGSFEIIGQPIRLADILLAVDIFKRGQEQMYRTRNGHFDLSICKWYNLSKDNILDQSDETAQFIYDIIKV